MRKYILIAFLAVAFPTLPINASAILSHSPIELSQSQLTENDGDYFYSDMRRRPKRGRRSRNFSRLSSPFAVGGSVGTVNIAKHNVLATGINFDFAYKNRKQEYKTVFGTQFNLSLPLKFEQGYAYYDDNIQADIATTRSISVRTMMVSAYIRNFFAGELTSKLSIFYDVGVGYAFMPYTVEYKDGPYKGKSTKKPADVGAGMGFGFASNIGICQFTLRAHAFWTPKKQYSDEQEIDVLEWSGIMASIRIPIGG